MPDAATVKIRKLDGRKMVGKVIAMKIDGADLFPGELITIQGHHGVFRVIKPRRVK